MKTNSLMLRELLEQYHPATKGIVSGEEHALIRNILCLSVMDILALRNLRDYVVASLSRSRKVEDWDRMSAITYCIDSQIYQLGGEV